MGETALALLQSPQPPPVAVALTALLNEIAQFHRDRDDGPYLLIFDDYHHVVAQPVHQMLTFLLEKLPPYLHLVIISRVDPPLPLSRLRARGHMTEVRQADLSFTTQEAAAFLSDVMGLPLSSGQIEVLVARTEGWIAGPQLAALSMRGRDDLAGYVAAFSGSHRFVIDYVTDEVLQQQDAHIRRFLSQTAILDRLTAELCNADSLVVSQALLAQIYLAQGEIETACELLQDAMGTAHEKRLTATSESWLAAIQLKAWLARGNVVQAARWAMDRGLRAADEVRYVREVEYMALARLLLARGEWQKSEDLLARLLAAAEAGGRTGREIEIRVLQALTFQAEKRSDQAVAILEQALILAEPEGYMRTFIDAGSPLPDMLKLAAAHPIAPIYASRLQTAFPAQTGTSFSPELPPTIVVEPLSEHECRVLRPIAAGFSNQEAADELMFSINTIKWHLKQIYAKLDARGRVEAIARAQELGLLQPRTTSSPHPNRW